MRSISLSPLAIVGLLVTALAGNSVRAEVRVQGPLEDVRLEASTKILAALSERFELRVQGTTANRRITGTYEGPLRHVLARIFVGYDYVIKPNGANIDLIVLGTEAPRQAMPAPPPTVQRRAD